MRDTDDVGGLLRFLAAVATLAAVQVDAAPTRGHATPRELPSTSRADVDPRTQAAWAGASAPVIHGGRGDRTRDLVPTAASGPPLSSLGGAEIACMCCALLSVILLLVGTVFAIIRLSRRRARREGMVWAATAASLGLELEGFTSGMRSDLDRLRGREGGPGHPTTAQPMRGRYRGVQVSVAIHAERSTSYTAEAGARRSVTYFTTVRATMPSRLLVGLLAKPRGLLGMLASGTITVGHPHVDAAFMVKAVDAAYASHLLRDEAVARALLSHRGPFTLELSDESVVLRTEGMLLSDAPLRAALDVAAHVAHTLGEARQRLGAPAIIAELERSWRPLASARGWRFDPGAATLSGNDFELQACLRPEGSGTHARMKFAQPLGIGLRVQQRGALAKVASFFGMQDVKVGEKRFDDRFIVQGRPEDRVRALLTPEVREHLFYIDTNAASMELTDDGVTMELGHLVTDAAQIEHVLSALARVAGAMR